VISGNGAPDGKPGENEISCVFFSQFSTASLHAHAYIEKSPVLDYQTVNGEWIRSNGDVKWDPRCQSFGS
jgi:hypothetical protein